MYVSPIPILLLTGRSTPTTRAILVLSPSLKSKIRLPLALLVLGVGADHTHHALAVDDLAVVAHLLDRSPNLHLTSPLSGLTPRQRVACNRFFLRRGPQESIKQNLPTPANC